MERFLAEVASCVARQSGQVAAAFALVALACWRLRRASAHWRYLLWLIVLAKCLAPPLVSARIPALSPHRARPTMPAPDSLAPTPAASVEAAPPAVPPAPGSAALRPAPPIRPAPEQLLPTLTAAQWAAAAWLVGAAGLLALALLKACRLRRRLRRGRRAAGAALREETAGLARGLGLRRAPRVWLLDGGAQPFVWGLLRGAVYLPSDLAAPAATERRRQLVTHELAHVARWDALVNAVQVLVQALFFFHPLVWWANRRLRQEREKCCDETAVAALGVRPSQYGAAILDALGAGAQPAPPLPSLAVAGPVSDLEERMRTLMRPNRTFHKRPTWQAILAASFLAALVLPTGLALTAPTPAAAAEPHDPGEAAAPPQEKPEGEPDEGKTRPRYFVRLVLGRRQTTFEGRPVGWGGLPAALQRVPERPFTVLEVAIASRRVSKEVVQDALALAECFGFERGMHVGVQPLGSKGPATQTVPVEPQGPAALAAKRRFVGLWAGLAVDKPGQGISRDPLTIELRLGADGRLGGRAYGRFAQDGQQDLENVTLWGNRLELEVAYRAGGSMRLLLALDKDRLVGEAGSVDGDGAFIDVSLRRVGTWPARPRPIPPALARPFAGRWQGIAADKPGHGTSKDSIQIELKMADDGVLTGTASGRFVGGHKRPVWNVQVGDGRLQFELVHRTGVRMRVTLKTHEGELRGEAIPLDVDEDPCDITLKRPKGDPTDF